MIACAVCAGTGLDPFTTAHCDCEAGGERRLYDAAWAAVGRFHWRLAHDPAWGFFRCP